MVDPRAMTGRQELVRSPVAAEQTAPEYWDINDIQFHCRIGRTTAWRLVRRPSFPVPILVSAKRLVWSREEVVDFLEGQREPERYRRQPTAASLAGDTQPSYAARPVRARKL